MYKLISPKEIPDLTKGCKIIGVDTETTGFDFWRHKLVYVQFATSPGNSYMVDARNFVPQLKTLLADPSIGKVFHKASFDVNFLSGAGYEVSNIIFDTKVAAYLLNNTQENGLKDLARAYLRVKHVIEFDDIVPKAPRAKKGQIREARKTIADIPIESAVNYACADADHTLRLTGLFTPEIERCGFNDLMQMELGVQDAITKMMRAGCKLDMAKVDELRLKVQKERFHELAEIKKILGPEININSPDQLNEALYCNLGLPVVGVTDKGTPSSDATCLEYLENDHIVVKHLSAYKKYEKLLTTYLEPCGELVDSNDCIHGSFNQCVTDTGRLSSSGPNLQNIPVKTELGKEYRKCFISRFPGGQLFVSDYSQIEVRILAHLSQDKLLLHAYNEEKDPDMHKLTAMLLFNVKIQDVTREMRNVAKTLNFGVIFGMSARKLSVDAGIGYSEAEGYIETYFTKYSGVKDFKEYCLEFVEKNGYLETILGRRLYIAEGKFVGTRALNYPVQGSAAEVVKKAMVACAKEIKDQDLKTLMVLQVHDELVFDVPKDEQKLIKIKMPNLMNNVIPISVDLPVDAKMVGSWGLAKE